MSAVNNKPLIHVWSLQRRVRCQPANYRKLVCVSEVYRHKTVAFKLLLILHVSTILHVATGTNFCGNTEIEANNKIYAHSNKRWHGLRFSGSNADENSLSGARISHGDESWCIILRGCCWRENTCVAGTSRFPCTLRTSSCKLGRYASRDNILRKLAISFTLDVDRESHGCTRTSLSKRHHFTFHWRWQPLYIRWRR